MKKANCNQKPNLKSTSEHTNHQTTPLFFKIALGLVVLLFFPSFTFSQTNLSCNATINPTALVSDYTIPTGINSLTFTIKGGDGGDAYLKGGTCDIRMRGGAGATVTATFEIGTADDQLQAGGTLRVFVGRKGGTEQTRCAPIPVTVTGSGGGSSAILYLPPGKSSTATEWFLLAEAGAGGGGARPLANVFRSGQGGNQSESGRNVGNISGGVVGVRCASGVSSTGKGGQLDCNRSDDRNGGTIVSNTQGLNNYSTAQLQLLDNTAASNTGGTRGNRPEGGDGFSGGGVQGNGGGGGGGFGGGANNTWSQGGGGGSFVNIFFKGNNKEKTGGTDGGGTESDGTASITTTTAPISAQCQDKTVLIFSTTVGISVQDIDNGSSIGCGTGTISLDKSTFTCSDIGDNTVTLTIQEGNNTSSCTSVVSIVDRTLPTARCRNVTVNLDNTGNGTLTAAEVDNGSVDFCGIASRSIDHTSFDCSSPSPQNVTLTVIDNHGNSAICNAIVTIDKPTIPTALCKDHTVQLDATGNGVISITNVDNGSIDVCGNISLSLDKTSFTCADVGNNTVTLTVRTSPSNQATCTSNVTVEDKFAPIIACPNIFATLDQNGTATISPQQLELFALDNCRVVSRSLDQTSFDCSNLGDNDVTITVTDINSNSSTCRVNLKVVDVTEPTARCKDVTVYLDESGAASLSANDIDNDSKDNCGITNRTLSKTSFDCSNVGSNTVTLTLSDKSGNTSNCTSTVTVKDEAKPTALCQNVTVNLDNNGSGILSAAEVNAGSTDNCTIASVSIDKASFNCNSDEVEEVTLTVTDVNGNTSTCTSDVTINTSAVLKAVCRDIDVFVNANGTGFFLENEIDGGSVGCGNLRFSDDRVDVTCADVGTTRTITLVVFDENLNRASCTGIVSIKDEISPQANCKDIELILDGNGMATLTPQRIDNSSNDNCSVTNLSLSKTSFDCSNIGSNTIVLTATDGSGNSSTCTSIVTVADKRPPTAICQNVSVQIGNNNSTDIAAQIGASSVDNCGIASYMLDKTAFTCDDLGDNTVQLIVTDESGN
ncbi:MAG: HYR domain-containing protein, partial [Bacteroidota bacterium]